MKRLFKVYLHAIYTYYITHDFYFQFLLVHLVLHPHGIEPTFLKLDCWSPGAGFIPIITTNGKNQIKKGKLCYL